MAPAFPFTRSPARAQILSSARVHQSWTDRVRQGWTQVGCPAVEGAERPRCGRTVLSSACRKSARGSAGPDVLTFRDGYLTLWLAGTEVGHFPLEIIESVSPETQPGRIRDSPEELRVRYPNMGTPWSAEGDKRLL